ncbi:hypothetical protein LMG28688_02305 [Paraburkholderia caffeinitolerans]|uniref:Acyltransferase 3 domain-containing protein n=1 Tax=Paraburkholderia caffeinitolerans TaxID=1723730 RepID=A0A6J5FXD5_9BURK|nr:MULTISPECIES: acyltransferase [Paraburkholderia]CAB3786603.1 hypothetical protein LMG28688_02305 [Paraburkholderia caffeinitolerans]
MRNGDSKPHFIVLDGLRGIAAIAVVCLHAIQLLADGHPAIQAPALAVDFFFCLSGFVVAYVYGSRLDAGMSLGEFVAKRALRLCPMIFLGATLGAGVLVMGALHRGGLGLDVLVEVTSAFLLIPAGLFFGLQAYPVSNPMWSLFFECFANIVYAMFPRRSLAFLYVVLAISALALVQVSYTYNGLDAVGFNDWNAFVSGFVRVCYPFLAGTLICRLQVYKKLPSIPAAVVIAMLIATLSIDMHPTWVYQAACSLLVFPVIVAIAANSQPVALHGVLTWLGNISYPLYLIHHPLLRIVRNVAVLSAMSRNHPLAMIVVCVVASCALATLVLHAYDEKVRRWATAVLGRRLGFAPAPPNTARAQLQHH